jgi:hypothetical protein
MGLVVTRFTLTMSIPYMVILSETFVAEVHLDYTSVMQLSIITFCTRASDPFFSLTFQT